MIIYLKGCSGKGKSQDMLQNQMLFVVGSMYAESGQRQPHQDGTPSIQMMILHQVRHGRQDNHAIPQVG
jgi:hypothetical protein